MTKVVVTGVGLVLPGANTLHQLGTAVAEGRSAIDTLDRFDPAGHTSTQAAVVDDSQLAVFGPRLTKRMDRFCTMAMVAAKRAMEQAGLLANDGASLSARVDAERTGVYLGNMFGGWEATEQSMRRLCQIGYTGVSPYVASAWFPTAAQGQISINLGLKGFAKTIIGDTASSALALGYAAAAIRDGRADVMLAGGAEAPVTPYSYTFCTTSGRMSATAYRPFHPLADGFQVGEGSVVFVLEALEHARRRNAPVLAEITGFATGHAPTSEIFAERGAQALSRVAAQALDGARIDPAEVDYVGLDAQGRPDADREEEAAMCHLLGGRLEAVTRRTVKPVTGHLLGAAAATEVAGALQAISSSPTTTKTALVNARGADGTIACCVVSAV